MNNFYEDFDEQLYQLLSLARLNHLHILLTSSFKLNKKNTCIGGKNFLLYCKMIYNEKTVSSLRQLLKYFLHIFSK